MKRKREKCEEVEEESNSKKRKIEQKHLSKKAKDFLEKAIFLIHSEDESENTVEEVLKLITSCLKIEPNNSHALFLKSSFYDKNDPKELNRARNELDKSFDIYEKELVSKIRALNYIDVSEELSRLYGYECFSLGLSSVFIKFCELSGDDEEKETEIVITYETRLLDLSNELLSSHVIASNEFTKSRSSDIEDRLNNFIRGLLTRRGTTHYIRGSFNLAFNDFIVCKKFYESQKLDTKTKEKLMSIYFYLGMISVKLYLSEFLKFNVNSYQIKDLALKNLSLFLKYYEEGIDVPEDIKLSEIGLTYFFRGRIFIEFNEIVKGIKDYSKAKNFFDGEFIILLNLQRQLCVEKLKSKIFKKSSIKF